MSGGISMLQADEKLVRQLIFESGISRYRISKDTGVPSTTLADLASGKTDIGKMQFNTVSKLTEYASKILTNEKG